MKHLQLGRIKRLGPLQLLRVLLIALIGIFCLCSLVVYERLLPPQEMGYLATTHEIKGDFFIPYPYRCDQVFPKIHQGRSLQLSSVPAENRLPISAMTNVTEYFLFPQDNITAHREYFFDYNPSIIQLPRDQRSLPGAVYLASFRVSNLNYCFHPEDRKRMVHKSAPKPKDWLGLAILSEHWEIIGDVVVDLAARLRTAQDFRLFVLSPPGHENTQQIYVSSNDVLLPLWLDAQSTRAIPTVQLPVVFGNDFQVWVPSDIPLHTWCAPCGKPRMCGKNFHFFASQGQLWAEVWPSAPHLIRSVSTAPCQRKLEPNYTYVTEDSPVASFRNKEVQVLANLDDKPAIVRRAKAPAWLTRGRGSTCCLSIKHPGSGAPLLMGIAHSKTLGSHGMPPNHYLSTLYAFSDAPPFALVAQSGYFCLPFPSDNEGLPLLNVTRWRVLHLGDDDRLIYPDCPRIHFVSGLTRDEEKPDQVIVAYGVNDCFSHFIKVNVFDLVHLLFYGPK